LGWVFQGERRYRDELAKRRSPFNELKTLKRKRGDTRRTWIDYSRRLRFETTGGEGEEINVSIAISQKKPKKVITFKRAKMREIIPVARPPAQGEVDCNLCQLSKENSLKSRELRIEKDQIHPVRADTVFSPLGKNGRGERTLFTRS